MRYALLGVLIAVWSAPLIIAAEGVPTTTSMLSMPTVRANSNNIGGASSSSVECEAYAALIGECQSTLPTTAVTQSQLPLLQCLCSMSTFYSVYAQCTASMNLTVWPPTQFATYCQYINDGNVTLLPNNNIGPTGMVKGSATTFVAPIVITIVTYSNPKLSMSSTAPPYTSSSLAPSSSADNLMTSRASAVLHPRSMLATWTMSMIALQTLLFIAQFFRDSSL